MEEQNKPFNIYCNGIDISTSAFDFTFALKNTSPRGEVFLGELKMSPEHAKVFASILMQNVANFEELFGPIPQMNEDKLKQLESLGKIKVEGLQK